MHDTDRPQQGSLPKENKTPDGVLSASLESEKTLTSYELALIFMADLGEQGVENELEEISSFISSHDGNISHKEVWGIKDLAYIIRKEEKGFYVILNMSLPGSGITELEKTLNIKPSVLRYLLLKTPNNYQTKSFDEYQEENKKIAEEKEKQKESEKAAKGPKVRQPVIKAEPKKEEPKPEPKKVEKKKAPEKKEEPEEEKPKKAVSEKTKLDDFDQKLKSIIDDPDISL